MIKLSISPEVKQQFKKPFYTSLGVHGVILLLLIIAAITFPEKIFKQQSVNVVSATTISEPIKVRPTHKQVVKKSKPMTHKSVVKKAIALKKPAIKKDVKRSVAHPHVVKKTESKKALLAKRKQIAEQKRLAAIKAKQITNMIDRYNALILQSIGNHWIIPQGVNKQLTSKLFVQVAPDGSVLSVQLLKSSGNVQLDRSAIAAIYKASPLPVPEVKSVFDRNFKQLTLIVRPEDVIG